MAFSWTAPPAQQPAPPTAFSFGQRPLGAAPPAASGLFQLGGGAPSLPGQSFGGSSLAGQPLQQAPYGQSYGQPYGQQQAQPFGQQQVQPFGQQQAQPFGQQAQQQGQRAPSSFATHPFQFIQECLDPASENYRFRYFFYNAVPGGSVASPQARPALVSERLWTQVVNDNPDAARMVPVLVNGFDDVNVRIEWQRDVQAAQRRKLQELEERTNALLARQDLDVATQIQCIQQQQLGMTLRILRLFRSIETMRRQGQRLSPQEQALLGRIQAALGRLAHQGVVAGGTVDRLAAQMQALADSGRLDPMASTRHALLSDADSIHAVQAVLDRRRAALPSSSRPS